MIEKYMSKEAADRIYMAGMVSGMMQKQSAGWMDVLKTVGGGLATIGGGAKDLAGKLIEAAKATPGMMLTTAGLGAGIGALGASAWDVIKERVSQEDPEAEFNQKIEAMYARRKRELDDSNWMTRIRGMRDELKRDGKKMSAKEYADKYHALEKALNEKA